MTLHAQFNTVHAWDTWPPKQGPTGAPVVGSDITWRSDVTHHHVPPPSRPTRIVDVYDDEGEPCGTRALTDEEFANLMTAYENARAWYDRTGGVHAERGRTEVHGTFKCVGGGVAEATGDGHSGWRWVSWDSAPKENAAPA